MRVECVTDLYVAATGVKRSRSSQLDGAKRGRRILKVEMALISQVLAKGQVTGLSSQQKYSLRRFLAGGDNGEVYVAEREDGKEFAVKVCKPDPRRIGIFNLKNEIDRLVTLSEGSAHRNVICFKEQAIFSPEILREKLCYAMEKCDITAKNLMDGPQISELAFTEICFQAFSGLAFVHSKDIVHRDIRNPGNILLQWDGQSARVVIADFGNAKQIIHRISYEFDLDARQLASGLLKLIRRRCLSDPTNFDPPMQLPSTLDWDFLYDTLNIPDSDEKDFARAISLVCCVSWIPGFNESEIRKQLALVEDRDWWPKFLLCHPKQASYIKVILEFLSQSHGPDGTKIPTDLFSILSDALAFTDLQRRETAVIEQRLAKLSATSITNTHQALLEHLTNYFA